MYMYLELFLVITKLVDLERLGSTLSLDQSLRIFSFRLFLPCNEKEKKIKIPCRFGRGTMVVIRLKGECLCHLVTNLTGNLILVARCSHNKYERNLDKKPIPPALFGQ